MCVVDNTHDCDVALFNVEQSRAAHREHRS